MAVPVECSGSKDEDFVEHVDCQHSRDGSLFLEPRQGVLAKSVPYPAGQSKLARSPYGELTAADEEERDTSILPIDGYDENQFIFMATAMAP